MPDRLRDFPMRSQGCNCGLLFVIAALGKANFRRRSGSISKKVQRGTAREERKTLHRNNLDRVLTISAAVLALFATALFAAEPGAEPPPAAGAFTLGEADSAIEIGLRMLEGGIHDRALELADSVLSNPGASALDENDPLRRDWLARREAARFVHARAALGLAASRDAIEDAAEAFVQLSNNRYRLAEPAYNIQSAYWAGRAYESIGMYREAVDNYSRVGGVSLPQEMEGDAAQRMSRCLRLLAEEIPFPGALRDRQRRDRLLNQAIGELDRARLAFPIGNRRREIELDRIALRMARREEQFVREAATEAEAYIESDPAKDELRARAALYRGQAAAMLGQLENAATWFRRVTDEEAPSVDDARRARLGLALALVEMSGSAAAAEKAELLRRAAAALDNAIAGAMSPGPWDGARIIKARVLLALDRPTAALETLAPVLSDGRMNHPAWLAAGMAELARGRPDEAFARLYPSSRPSNPNPELRYASCTEAARTADSRRDSGIALALNHQASRMLRRDRLFSALLQNEFTAMETILALGRTGGPISLSGDVDLLMSDAAAPLFSAREKRERSVDGLGLALGRVLAGGGDPDSGYDLAVNAEAAHEWSGDGLEKLELAIAMISHLRKRQPPGVTDSTLSSRLGEARQALALARAERVLAGDEPDEAAVNRALGDFAAASASFQEASAGGFSLRDSLDQGMVNMESGAFLMRLAERWERGKWSGAALAWRDEARQRIEASLRPFNQAIATSGPSSLAARRAKWSRGRALELLEEWRGAAADYLSLMNNSELPRLLRANAARRWALCMGEIGESRAALTRLAVFADIDAEAALQAGRLAEEAGYPREAFQHYLFAADPDSPSIPPATPGRVQEAAYRAARLALDDPDEANPLLPAEQVIDRSRRLLRDAAGADVNGPWAVAMLNLLGESWLSEPDGWQTAYRLAAEVMEDRSAGDATIRAMYVLGARALAAGGEYAKALDDLDAAGDLLDGSEKSRKDAAAITLETARVYRGQGRVDDALRAYANVFAVYPEQEESESAARTESAIMLLSRPDAGEREREQARGILSGLRDQVRAEKIMREYGIR